MQGNMMGQNIIITDPSSNLRALGRNALKNKWKVATLACIVYTLCLNVPTAILDTLFGRNTSEVLLSNGYYSYNMDADMYSSLYNQMPSVCPLSAVYTLLVTGAFTLGISILFLAAFRGHKIGVTDVFLGFEKFGKALGLLLYVTLFTILWSFLFIIPGIIASIRYSQAFFILADDPTKGIRQCVNESKQMMAGNKWKLFCLELSFIGWAILAGIPAGLLTAIGNAISSSPAVVQIFAILGALCTAPVTAYMYSTTAGFYEILAGHLIKETKPVPVEPENFDIPKMETAEPAAEEPATTIPAAPVAPVAPVEEPAAPAETPVAEPAAPAEEPAQEIPAPVAEEAPAPELPVEASTVMDLPEAIVREPEDENK